jgi:NADPH:quinone reductase-like Zn-dependent oxidoreductase
METMKAVRCRKYGPPEVLEITEVAKPLPKVNEVLIKIHATTVTAGDHRMRSFDIPSSYKLFAWLILGFSKPKNDILGMELAGTIEAVGSKVSKYKAGDQVFAQTVGHKVGGYAEYKCLPENCIIEIKPEKISFTEAAAIPVGGRTALYFLKSAKIKPGQKVLIYGASGSVGTYAVQLAKYFETEVTAVCSSQNHELLKSIGADHVINYRKEDFTANGKKYDIIFDTVGKTNLPQAVKSLNKGGAFLHAVSTPAVTMQMQWQRLTAGKRMIGGGPEKDKRELSFLKKLIEEDQLKVVIDRSYPLEEIVEAHRYVDQGHKKGNVAIIVA